ncbi:MAG: hypothetical protein DWQ31_16545 [Planctomycetota bacterium]|nr:MAG: hypothetical protein DWQ31_16545 [Planctomycetota bacterium]
MIVEMHPAYLWDCPECGREKFERSIVVERSPETIAELREDLGIEQWEEGDFVMIPSQVTCDHCQLTFDTHDWRADAE